MKLFSIRNKLIFCFFLPIAFMVVIGLAAYNSASKGISEKYENSTMETINMAAQYVDMASSFVKSEATQYAYNEDLIKFVSGILDGDQVGKKNARESVEAAILSGEATNPFIQNVHIVTKAGIKMFSTKTNNNDGIYDEYYAAVTTGDKYSIVSWIDSHPLLDENFKFSDRDSYILAYETMGSNKGTIIVVDMSENKLQEFLDGIDIGDNGVVALVTPNGREIFHESVPKDGKASYSAGKSIFYGNSFYNEAVTACQGEKKSGCKTVIADGKEQIFFYAASEVTGAMICALVPTSTIVLQAENIKTMTLGVVIVCAVIVFVLGFWITHSIRKNMLRISGKLTEVSEGDLTVCVTAKGKDEFQDLAGSANDMIHNTKNLVSKVNSATDTLEMSAIDVKKASMTLSDCSDNIENAISDINAGIDRQARHANECVETTDRLSDEIQIVSDMVNKVKSLVDETGEMISEGVELIGNLGERAAETTTVTGQVGTSIENLRNESERINDFVGIITRISSQTNLLSLNASIEAARAGDAGRGFAVVAEQIMLLADESSKAAGEIQKVVERINGQTETTVEDATKASDIVLLQSEIVKRSVEVFENMQHKMEELIGALSDIRKASDAADTRRLEAVEAVRSISQIIDETAENAARVIGSSKELVNSVENLNSTADALGINMDELKTEIAGFRV